MNNDIRQQKKHEKETEAYKAFLVIAKRLQKIEYANKWVMMPDPADPLRKFIIQRETPWFTLQLVLKAKEFRHRGDLSDNAYDYRFYIGFQGIYADVAGPITLISSLEVRPRVVKKLIACINERVIPNAYADFIRHVVEWDKFHNREKYFQENLLKLGVNKPEFKSNMRVNIAGDLLSDPKLEVMATSEGIEIRGKMSFERFEKIAKVCGWIK